VADVTMAVQLDVPSRVEHRLRELGAGLYALTHHEERRPRIVLS